jgi:hypothetical protein
MAGCAFATIDFGALMYTSKHLLAGSRRGTPPRMKPEKVVEQQRSRSQLTRRTAYFKFISTHGKARHAAQLYNCSWRPKSANSYRRLLVYRGASLRDQREHTVKSLFEPGLVQLATIKANSHVANTTPAPPSSQNATPPFVVFIILSLRFVSSG